MANNTTANIVVQAVVEEIKASGVTVVWLCEKTGIPRSTLVRRLNGATAFDLNELDRIAAALRIPTSRLLRSDAA
ncbi:helix-turn-helix domain-containing protein [Pimelobacter simplex]|nr:helix-turn-helix transcriptional regulator [Pimelobacter simplex]